MSSIIDLLIGCTIGSVLTLLRGCRTDGQNTKFFEDAFERLEELLRVGAIEKEYHILEHLLFLHVLESAYQFVAEDVLIIDSL